MIRNLMTRAAGIALAVALLLPLSSQAQMASQAQISSQPAPQPAPAAEDGHPLMWVVHGPQGTLYLLGSFHLLQPAAHWEDGRIDNALAAADHVWFELTGFDDQAQAMQAFRKYGFYAAPELSTHLDPDTTKRLTDALTRHGMNFAQVQAFKPWAVAIVLADKELADDGFDGGQGVDLTLYHKALAAGKDVEGFETMDLQMGILAHADDDDGLSLLKETLKDDDDGPAKMAALAQAWLHGDEPALVKDSVTEMKADYPALYKRILVDRNISWEPRVDDMARAKGTTLVVVGAGHLIGPDGIVAHLKAEGFTVDRVQ